MLLSEKIMETTEKIKENIEQLPKIAVASFKRWNSTTFLRVADLQMTAPPQAMEGMDESERCPNFHTPSQDPHLAWIGIHTKNGSHWMTARERRHPLAPMLLRH
jgi:hypothetical protein